MNVRLKQFEINSIIKHFKDIFPSGDNIWLFGSRVDMQKRGGDIDLYIETKLSAQDAYNAKINLVNNICDDIGDQKIDVVLNVLSTNDILPIYNKARKEGVLFV